MIGTTRTAFNGAVRGKVVSVTATGVILGGQNGMVREINARNLDPVKSEGKRRRRFTPNPAKAQTLTRGMVAEKPSPKVSKPKTAAPRVETLVITERKVSDFERVRKHTAVTDRTQYADK